jgi:SagB-type dehydrogenase family enzyme
MTSDSLQTVLTYHEATKHHFQAFARSAGYLDWAIQPVPFRWYEGAPRIALSHPSQAESPSLLAAMRGAEVAPHSLDADLVAQLFRDSLSISAWKQLGQERWALRVNPSSGNLHPTEGYLVCGPVGDLSDTPFVAHYFPREHALEMRADLPAQLWVELGAGLPENSVLVGLTSILWREAWKYGERAFRYCQLDVGHALAALTMAAAGLGWRTRLVTSIAPDALTALLGLTDSQGVEKEYADCLVAVYPGTETWRSRAWPAQLTSRLRQLAWRGEPNRLSQSHREWPIVYDVAAAQLSEPPGELAGEMSTRPQTGGDTESSAVSTASTVVPSSPGGTPPDASTTSSAGSSSPGETPPGAATAVGFGASVSLRRIIQQRRSAVAMDGQSQLDGPVFYQMLAGLQAAAEVLPYAVLPWAPTTHLFCFVHRVRGLAAGLYCLVRQPDQLRELQQATRGEFVWQVPPGCSEDLGFFLLQNGDLRKTARLLACGQDIAADGCFSLAMVVDFAASLRRYGAGFYSRLFWECGLIGQVLYLQAEAAALRGTGIGCFFDDPVHELLGLTGNAYQSLYHFTVGGPLEDERITTLPPYPAA